VCIFQSEQVIKLRFWQKVTSLIFKSYTQLHFVDEKAIVNASYYATMRRYQKYTAKLTNIAEQKTASLSIWNDLPKVFVDKAILSFWKRLRSCVAAAGGHFEQSV